MQVKLTMSTPQIDIGENAKICYATKQFESGGKDITGSLVHGHSHLAALRFAYATFSVEGISVACQNQVVRSSHLDFMVQSKRYVEPSKGGFEFIMPEGLDAAHKEWMRIHWDSSINTYNLLLKNGVKKEDARAVLPANTSTKMNITGNLQGYWDAFKLRLNPHAQSEIRELFEKMYDLLQDEFPQVFTDEQREKFRTGK